MTDMDKILQWMNSINRDIKSLERRIDKVSQTVLNTRGNSNLFLKIQKFGIQMDEMSKRILKLELDDDGSSS